jgi:hypothetical protein
MVERVAVRREQLDLRLFHRYLLQKLPCRM